MLQIFLSRFAERLSEKRERQIGDPQERDEDKKKSDAHQFGADSQVSEGRDDHGVLSKSCSGLPRRCIKPQSLLTVKALFEALPLTPEPVFRILRFNQGIS